MIGFHGSDSVAGMGKFERYDPRNEIFDGGEFEEEDEEGSRLPLLLVIGLLVVAAFAGVVWLAYTQGVQRGRADAPRMLVAANGPVKEAPVNPGGVETPFKNLKIYQQPAPPPDEMAEPAPLPQTPKVAAPVATKAINPRPAQQVNSNVAPVEPNAPVQTASAPRAGSMQPHRLSHPASSQPTVAAAAVPEHPSQVVAKADEPAAGAPADTAVASEATGKVALQIGAYKSEAEAKAAWKAFARRHSMADGYQSQIKEVDLGEKGVWFRLRLGSFTDKTAAVAFCEKLKADGGNCFLAR